MSFETDSKRRAGALEFCYNDDYRPVKSLRLKLDARLVFDALTAKDGRHFDYSTPDKHIAMLSQYTGKIGDHEVGIETLRHPDGRVSSETRLSPDLVLPGELISPVLTNMSTVDTNSMQGKPIRIVLNDGDSFLCVLMAPQHKWFKKHVDVKKFDKEYFICVERSGWKSLSDALHNTGGYISFEDVRTILRNDVKSIDLTPSIDAIIGMSNK